jgi:hypothetical protein
MANNLMPIGKPTVFEGDIFKFNPDAFGFFYGEITSPTYLEHPILQQKIKTQDGIRTIAGLGSWTGWVFSEELYNAMKYGYTFKIIKGYLFNKGNLFCDYVNKMYNLRLQYDKTNPMNQNAKLLNNSLYGKFGMKDVFIKNEILRNITPEDKLKISLVLKSYCKDIIDIIELDNHTMLEINKPNNNNEYHGTDVNVAVASAITAYARIHMSQYKNNPDYKLYYSDTDSIVINKPLPDHLVGTGLGKLKLEHIITKAVFLAPKVYALITEDGKEIIKVKGLTNEVISKLTFKDLESLLIKDSSREFSPEKWFKSLINADITTNDMIYTLKATSNKRQLIYNNGIFSETKPYNYTDIINNKA